MNGDYLGSHRTPPAPCHHQPCVPRAGLRGTVRQICPPAQHRLCCLLPPERQDLALCAQLAAPWLALSLPPSAAGRVPASPRPSGPGRWLRFPCLPSALREELPSLSEPHPDSRTSGSLPRGSEHSPTSESWCPAIIPGTKPRCCLKPPQWPLTRSWIPP